VFRIDELTALRILDVSDAPALFALTEANREHLRRWLPWLDAVTREADTRAYLETVVRQRQAGLGPVFGIEHEEVLAGVIGFHPLERFHRIGEIGYWLGESFQHRGIMTECCRFLVRYGFQTLDLNRIQIPVATGNRLSRAVPERLGFTLEGILREREYLNGAYVDHAMYAMLQSEFAAGRLAEPGR
jgi:ribosomal-protein-serine acetyltransferase